MKMILTAMLWIMMMTAYMCNATVIEVKDSADFSYKYEMIIEPSDEDVDSNGTNDFGNSNGTVDGSGIMTMVANGLYNSAAIGQAWDVMNPSFVTGYTLEIRVKIISQSESTGTMAINGSLPDVANANSWLNIGTNSAKWYSGGDILLDSSDNTDAFHVFRIVQQAGQIKYNVWRDGVLIGEDLGLGMSYTGLDRMLFGDPGGNWGGTSEVDYMRFIKGVYAPYTPLPSMNSNKEALLINETTGLIVAHDNFEQNIVVDHNAFVTNSVPDADPDNAEVGVWTLVSEDYTGVLQVTDYATPGAYEGSNCLRAHRINAWHEARLDFRNQTNINDLIHVQLMVYNTAVNNGAYFYLMDTDKHTLIGVFFMDHIKVHDGSDMSNTGVFYNANEWGRLDIKWYIGADTIDLMYNDTSFTVGCNTASIGLDRLMFSAGTGGICYFDSLRKQKGTLIMIY